MTLADAPYHHGNLRAAAVAAALAGLYDGATAVPALRDVARVIGVTHRALYRHFADRDAFEAAVAGAGFEALAAAMADATTARDVMQAYVGFALNDATLYRIMFARSSADLLHEPEPGVAVRTVIAIATRVFGEGADTRDRVIAAWGMAHGLCALWHGGALRADGPDAATAYILARLDAAGLV